MNFYPNASVNLDQSTKISFHKNKAIHSIRTNAVLPVIGLGLLYCK